MTSMNRTFRTRSLEFEKSAERPAQKPEFKPNSHELRDKSLDFSTASSTGEHLSCSASTHQALRVIGYDNTQIRDTLHTVDVLKNLAERPVDTIVFASVRERNGLGLGAMASIAAICNLRAADAGVTLRNAARFYARRKANVDVDEMERFVKWLVEKSGKGEPITGMPSEWLSYCRLSGRRVVKRARRGFRSASRRRRGSSKARGRNRASARKSESKPSGLIGHVGRFFRRR